MDGILLRIVTTEKHRHGGELLYEWLLEQAKKLGIRGGSAFRAFAGYGRHGRLHEDASYELAGDLPVEDLFPEPRGTATLPGTSRRREAIVVLCHQSSAEWVHCGLMCSSALGAYSHSLSNERERSVTSDAVSPTGPIPSATNASAAAPCK
jgi:hypothetical protein